MKLLKRTLLPVLFILLSLGLIFILELFLNLEQTEVLVTIVFIISAILFLYGLLQIIVGKTKSKFFKARRNGFILIAFVFMFLVLMLQVTAFNIGIYEAFQGEFTALEKVEMYKTFNSSIKEKKEYNSQVETYIKELTLKEMGYIDLYYDASINIEYLNRMEETIYLAEDIVEDILGDFKKEPLKVILYGDEEFKIDRFDSELLQGYFDGESIHIKKISEDQSFLDLQKIFIHEYMHYACELYYFENNIINPLPTWFNEGLAEYVANDDGNMEYSSIYIENPIDLQRLETSEKFSNALESGQNIEKFFDPYVYSYYIIDSLVDLKGQGVITDLMLNSKDMDFYEGFEIFLGVDIETYQKLNLVEYIEKKEQF